MTAQIFNPNTEFVKPIEIPTNKPNAKTKKQPLRFISSKR